MQPDRVGTAQWADPEHVGRSHAFTPGSFWLGRTIPGNTPVGVRDDRHVCLVSGSRSGKGTSVIVNNLCVWPGSVVVVDPAGENATLTASRRGPGSNHCEGIGQRIVVLDPYGEAVVDPAMRGGFNPLADMDATNDECVRNAERIAVAFIPLSNADEKFWENGARRLIAGLVLHVLTAPEYEDRRNLVTVRELIFRGDVATLEAVKKEEGSCPFTGHELLWTGMRMNPAFNGYVAGIGERCRDQSSNAPKQWEGVLDEAISATNFINNPKMEACLTTSSFRLADIKQDPRGLSLYLSIPQRFMSEDFRWLRMMVSLILTEMEAVKSRPMHPVLIVLDEFAGLKRMDTIETASAQIAKYGVKLFTVVQSLVQLKSVYKDGWEVFLSNCGVKMFFGLDDNFTREYVSKQIGETELVRTTHSTNQAENWQIGASRGTNSSDATSTNRAMGSNWGENESAGSSRNDSFKRFPVLRDTAGLVRKITGEAEASNSRYTSNGRSAGGSITDSSGSSRTEGESAQVNVSRGGSTGGGTNETIHKRPLVNPDELGRYFSRINDTANPAYPGLAVVLISDGGDPCIVRRTNYFDDPMFARMFDPHPDHPLTPWNEVPLGLSQRERTAIALASRSWHGARIQWRVEDGGFIEKGKPYLTVHNLSPDASHNERLMAHYRLEQVFPECDAEDEAVHMLAPVSGVVELGPEVRRLHGDCGAGSILLARTQRAEQISADNFDLSLFECIVKTRDEHPDPAIMEHNYQALRARCCAVASRFEQGLEISRHASRKARVIGLTVLAAVIGLTVLGCVLSGGLWWILWVAAGLVAALIVVFFTVAMSDNPARANMAKRIHDVAAMP